MEELTESHKARTTAAANTDRTVSPIVIIPWGSQFEAFESKDEAMQEDEFDPLHNQVHTCYSSHGSKSKGCYI